MSDERLLCINCKHCIKPQHTWLMCGRTAQISHVDGETHYTSCALERSNVGACGPDAKLYESAEIAK